MDIMEKSNDNMEDLEGIPEDLTFPKATIDPKLYKLQESVVEFVISTILKNESDFYALVEKNCNEKKEDILGTTNPSIIEMITLTTNKFYNKIYLDIQNKNNNELANVVIEMCQHCEYGPHILLDKLLRLTIEAHYDVWREKLTIDNLDLYQKSILTQLSLYLLSKNILHIFSKGDGDDIPFVNVNDGNAFSISIDKNIL